MKTIEMDGALARWASSRTPSPQTSKGIIDPALRWVESSICTSLAPGRETKPSLAARDARAAVAAASRCPGTSTSRVRLASVVRGGPEARCVR
jgi:hypothetical protein